MAVIIRGLIPSYVVDLEAERVGLGVKPDFTLCYVRSTKISYNYDSILGTWVAVPSATIGLSKVKSTDQSIVSSTTFINDLDLQFIMLANEKYRFDIILFVKNTTNQPDFKFQLTSSVVPADIRYQVEVWPDNMTGAMVSHTLYEAINQVTNANWNSAPNSYCRLQGSVVAGATNSVLIVQWAPRVNSAVACVLKRGSSINIVKLVT